uniref:Uncharacterized protein n=1 Tax=Setaria digitata TaxID=48799 RepID=A0A915Q2J5_9BILA
MERNLRGVGQASKLVLRVSTRQVTRDGSVGCWQLAFNEKHHRERENASITAAVLCVCLYRMHPGEVAASIHI